MATARRWLALCALLSLAVTAASARIISYAPYSDRASFPVLQNRLNRNFVLIEGPPNVGSSPIPILAPIGYGLTGQVVLYDSDGAEEPRVIFPQDGSFATFTVAAVREDTRGVASILLQTTYDLAGGNPQKKSIYLLSTDSGTSWKRLQFESDPVLQLPSWSIDVGGPYARSRYSPVRIGTAEYPFVISTQNALVAVHTTGSINQLLPPVLVDPPIYYPAAVTLAGSDALGFRFLIRVPTSDTLLIVDLNKSFREIGKLQSSTSQLEGWITPDGLTAYVDERTANITIASYTGGTRTVIAQSASSDPISLFAAPAFDYSGAWIVQRGAGKPTTLSLHKGTLTEQWSDITAPEVEAIHAGRSGNALLIQVHRPRPQADQRLFIDPALAVWRVGQPAPRGYDELFLNETTTKGFVHLDVDALEAGDLFVFDSGAQQTNFFPGPITSPPPPVAGGGDVIQEWGVVRASLKQRLVLTGIGRTPGAFASFWQSDVIFYNPLDEKQDVQLRYAPSGEATTAALVNNLTITLDPREIRLVPDALRTLFGLESGTGAMFITPAAGINAMSRTYTRKNLNELNPTFGPFGTYGFSMNAVDVFTAASPRFPVSFAGAFPGAGFRTNMTITDVSGRGSETALVAAGSQGVMGSSGVAFSAAPQGQNQINNLQMHLVLLPSETGALLVQPRRGEAIVGVAAIDNRTNDPTYFPPDLPAPVVRTIPVIGHVDGANNSRFRSDLFLYNPSNQVRTVTLQAQPWDATLPPITISLTLLSNEARVIRDVASRLFNLEGFARLRYQSAGDSSGVRVTSRTYTIEESGATYGFLMPPLNAFQSASPGDALEILGVTGGAQYRTNIGLVEMSAFGRTGNASVRIELIDDRGSTIDAFTTNVQFAGGVQLNDIFRARGLGNGPVAALIRVTPLSGMIGAYASVVDNGTNDSIYLAANLAAHE